jgi:hypothetical protein
MRALRDRYGFLFWLRWILGFAGSFVVSAVCWTLALQALFGPIDGEELVLTWTVAVFGTWFILVIPFMRKKEQIWKRLNSDQESSVDAWFTGFGLFIALFVASAVGWDLALKQKLFPNTPGLDPAWTKAVFSTWLVILIPLLVWMYKSADRIFKRAHERQTREPVFRMLWIEPQKRHLPEKLAEKLSHAKAALPGGHVVHGRLKSGEVVEHLFVLNGTEVIGAYDLQKPGFDASELLDIQALDPEDLPAYDETRWVRFNIES